MISFLLFSTVVTRMKAFHPKTKPLPFYASLGHPYPELISIIPTDIGSHFFPDVNNKRRIGKSVSEKQIKAVILLAFMLQSMHYT